MKFSLSRSTEAKYHLSLNTINLKRGRGKELACNRDGGGGLKIIKKTSDSKIGASVCSKIYLDVRLSSQTRRI